MFEKAQLKHISGCIVRDLR